MLSSKASSDGSSAAAHSLSSGGFLSPELMLQNKGGEFDACHLQRSRKSEAAGFCRKEIYSSGQLNEEETIGETQISLPEHRVGINLKR